MPYFDDEDSLENSLPEGEAEGFSFDNLGDTLNPAMADMGGLGDINAAGEASPQAKASDATVTAQPVKFASFEDLDSASGMVNQNLGILLDVKLQLTVELGKTQLPIKKVLELTKGSVVTLDKVAGEPVELYANGKLIAHGEVVVIEDNFGLRITHITPPVKRLDTFNQLPHEVPQAKA